jgi:hypothetical protein
MAWPGWATGLLSTDNPGSFLSQLADHMEAVRLGTGVDVLAHARALLADQKAAATELRYAANRLAECLADALRVAESRGERLR